MKADPKKILVLLPDLFDSTGGIQTFNRCFVKALDEISEKHNLNLIIYSLMDNGKNQELFEKYIRSNLNSYKYFSGNKLNFSLESIKQSFVSNKIFIGHINFLPLALFMNSKAEKELIVHGVEVWEKISPFKELALSRIKNILSVSSFSKEEMMRKNNVGKEQFYIFPNTVDPFYAQNIKIRSREELRLSNGRMMLSVSRLGAGDEYKNIHLIIESMSEILKAVPDSFLVVVGDGNDKRRLEDLSLKLGLKDKIIFTGRVSDDLLPSYYNACDIFSLPSLKEGFGIVFLEAMYFNKPCVGANAGGIPEVIEHEKTGFLAVPNDTESLTKYLITLLKDNDLRNKMGKSGKERLEKEFSFDCFKNRLEKILINTK